MGSSNEHKRIVTLDVKLNMLISNRLSHTFIKAVRYGCSYWKGDASPLLFGLAG